MIALRKLGRSEDIYQTFEEAVTQHGIVPSTWMISLTCQSFVSIQTPPATVAAFLEKLVSWNLLQFTHLRDLINACIKWKYVPLANRLLQVTSYSVNHMI
jgi:hypothetical protein